MIEVSHLYYDYPGLRALDDINFKLPAQSITALAGPNGAGKTTLLRSMAALDEPSSGTIMIDGINVWNFPREAHLRMGYLPDHFGLYQELTAHQCLTYAAWTHGLRGKQMQQSVDWAIEQVGLLEQLPKLAGTLSRGQRQRLALAQAIVHRPKVLLMDEPASGLDPEARASLSDMMKNLAAQGMTLLISSHILAELETYCTSMLMLKKGQLVSDAGRADAAVQTSSAGMTVKPEGALILRIGVIVSEQKTLTDLCAWLDARGIKAKVQTEGYVLVKGSFGDDHAKGQLLRDLVENKWEVIEFALYTQSLQDVYMQTFASLSQAEGR